MYDAEVALAERVLTAVAKRSAELERGVLAVRNDGKAGMALVAPNLILFSQIVLFGDDDVDPLVFDLFLN